MDQIGRYRIVGELGRGAMGVVYHAIDPAIGRSVAIKTIRFRDIDHEAARERLRERLFREARSAGVLSHPNIVTIYDMDEADGLAYIAMAYVNGPTLEKILAQEQPLSGANMLRMLRQTALALDYAHAKGIVHRDVKPANIMTDEDGIVKMTDFGIAKTASGADITASGGIVGTLYYMSPEQAQDAHLDGRSDQFSLAVIAYEILTGERPFTGEHLSSILFKIVNDEPKAAEDINATLTPRINEVLRKGLAKNPEDRFQNCSAFVGALEMACAESRGWKTISATGALGAPAAAKEEPVGAAAAERGASPRRAWRLGTALAGVAAVLAAMGTFAWRSGELAPRAGNAGSAGPALMEAEAGAGARPAADPTTGPLENSLIADTAGIGADAPPAELPVAAPGANGQPPEQPGNNSASGGSSALVPQTDAGASRGSVAAKPSPIPAPAQTIRDAHAHESGADDLGLRETVHIPEAAPQDIWVTTNPPGAKAAIDGEASRGCNTPCMLQATPGIHHLTILQDGFLPEYREIHVADEAQEIPEIKLRKPVGTLMLTSNPPGAYIYINGQPLPQLTPAQVSLPPGTYDVRMEKDGRSEAQTVQLHQSPVYLRLPLNP